MPDAVKVFVSYSHQDNEYLAGDSLLGFLKGLEKDGISFWTDREIRPGEPWDQVIKDKLQGADIALVLVSQGFLDSDYCQNVEIKGFLSRKTHLFPVILSPCDWRRHEWLANRQFLPGGDRTIEEHYYDSGKRKRLFLEIRELLRERAEAICATWPVSLHPEERQALLELAGETRAKYEVLKWGEYQDKEAIIAQYLMQFFGKTIEESLKGEGKTITPFLKEKIREAAQGFLEDLERMRKS